MSNECEHGRLARKCETCADAEVITELREALASETSRRVQAEAERDGIVRETSEAARGIREALGRLDPMTDRYGKSLADAVRRVVADNKRLREALT